VIELTKADARVLLAHVLALLVGKEHVGREASLGGIGVWDELSRVATSGLRDGRGEETNPSSSSRCDPWRRAWEPSP
jgi:hypothetical protein